MTDEQKTASGNNTEDLNTTTQTAQAETETEQTDLQVDKKTALEEIIEKESAPKSKKNKSTFDEIKPDEIKPGMIVRVHQKIIDTNSKGEEKERIQIFQGMVIAHRHGKETGATFAVRKIAEGIGVEKIFPLKMPSIVKIELVRKYRVRQAKPYYLRTTKKRLREIKE
jgi:large subunit ribosomal protein L19